MTQNLDFAFSTKDKDVDWLDFSGVTGLSSIPLRVPIPIISGIDTLASMLGRTTSLLPNALFASLGMPKEESMTDVKHVSFRRMSSWLSLVLTFGQGIDHELRRSCEDVITACADSVCKPLRSWLTDRVSATGGAPVAPPSSPPPQEVVSAFTEACHRDLRAAVMKMRLYLEDDRTVAVLVKHAQERIVDEYLEFRREVWSATVGTEAQSGILSEDAVRSLLVDVCGSSDELQLVQPSTSTS